MSVFSFGAGGRTRLAHCGAWSFAALTVHRTVIHYRSYFESVTNKNKKEPSLRTILSYLELVDGLEPPTC